MLKKEEGEAYGFHLRVEWVKQGHIIRNVVSGGIAGRCGLEDGDRLLEVNNVYVEDAPHQEVNQLSLPFILSAFSFVSGRRFLSVDVFQLK